MSEWMELFLTVTDGIVADEDLCHHPLTEIETQSKQPEGFIYLQQN